MLGGWLMKRYPPKEINALYGYRTSQSRKSNDHWKFAQTYAAKEMLKWGFVMFLFSFLGYWIEDEIVKLYLGFILLMAMALIPIYNTEKALRKKFPK